MTTWQLQEAKARLSTLLNAAKHSPQVISRHGVNEAVLIGIEKYKELVDSKESIVSFFKNSPLNKVDLKLEREKSLDRIVEL